MTTSPLPTGLSRSQAQELLMKWGPNELINQGQKPIWKILRDQLTGVLVLVLIGAAGISIALKDYKDGVVILGIILLNTTLGVWQEYRAEKAMAALKRLSAPNVRVFRDGRLETLSARELVPGDLVVLETGNIIPADSRLLESATLQTQESILTGESLPVEKDPKSVSSVTTPMADRKDMLFQGTVIVHGRGTAVVEATGMRTELGRIAASVQKVQSETTPLQKRLDQLAKRLVVIIGLIAGVLFIIGVLRGESAHLMFLASVSLAVAAIPESLPAVVAIALALGAQRMLKHKALVRKLSAVETLGSVTVICTDKTGTLTENRMTVAVLYIAGHRLDLSEPLKRGKPVIQKDPVMSPDLNERPTLALLLAGGALCSDATLVTTGQSPGEFLASGDPTETAIVIAAAHFGLWKEGLEQRFPRIAELAFDSERKRMSTLHRFSEGKGPAPASDAVQLIPKLIPTTPGTLHFTKGSVESLLDVSSHVWVDTRAEPLNPEWKARILTTLEGLAQEGMRVLGVAYKESANAESPETLKETGLTFVGLIGMHDPVRPEAKEALRQCQEAGISVRMVTGDHPVTAQAIARELGMAGDRVMTGADFQGLSTEGLSEIIDTITIFARVAPEHKLKIVEALKLRGHVVAMTGDGVNDAPALKRADIGVAMGITGTDVSREAADMVLLDDNFATIVTAIREGRMIYDNIRKFTNYLLTTNSAEVGVMLLGPALGMPLPLLPLQILWINLVTDGPPALALGVEPAEPGVMKRHPRRPDEQLINRSLGKHIAGNGLFMAAVALLPGYWLWTSGYSEWQTYIFSTLVFSQLANVLAIRTGGASVFHKGLGSNRTLTVSVLGVLALQGTAMMSPWAQTILNIGTLTPALWCGSLGVSLSVFMVIEIEKGWRRRLSLRTS